MVTNTSPNTRLGKQELDEVISETRGIVEGFSSSEFTEWVESSLALIEKKNRDYATTTDSVYSNFELVGSYLGLVPELSFLALMGTKVARIISLVEEGKDPQNESLRDSYFDLLNYSILLKGYLLYSGARNKLASPSVIWKGKYSISVKDLSCRFLLQGIAQMTTSLYKYSSDPSTVVNYGLLEEVHNYIVLVLGSIYEKFISSSET